MRNPPWVPHLLGQGLTLHPVLRIKMRDFVPVKG
jgi:hypothetical protein